MLRSIDQQELLQGVSESFSVKRNAASLKAKRLADMCLGTVLLLLLGPIALVSAAVMRLSSRGPAFFVQPRIGLHGDVFDMYKIRTMLSGAEALTRTVESSSDGEMFFKPKKDWRVTAVGYWLRRLSIDEIPQLVNVLKGDMSLVGPRPLLLSDFDNYPRGRQLRRFSMKPGLTGLWQIRGRSECSDRERLELDLYYVDNWSFTLDVKILLKTVPVVLSMRGAN